MPGALSERQVKEDYAFPKRQPSTKVSSRAAAPAKPPSRPRKQQVKLPREARAERDRQVAQLVGEGQSLRAVAKLYNLSRDQVHDIARKLGVDFEQVRQERLARAHQANASFGAERRSLLRSSILVEAEAIVARLREPHLVYSFTARGYEEEEHDLPTANAIRDYAAAIRNLTDSAIRLMEYDEGAGGKEGADVDNWLDSLTKPSKSKA